MPKSLLVLFCGIFAAGFAFADWTAVQAIEPGAPIMVRSGFVTDAGRFVSATADAVVVETRAGKSTIGKDEIDDVIVYRSQKDRTHRALLWGGIAAGGTAAAFFPLTARLANP